MNELPVFESTNQAQQYGRAICDPYVIIALQHRRERNLRKLHSLRGSAVDESGKRANFNEASKLATLAQFDREAIEAFRELMQMEVAL